MAAAPGSNPNEYDTSHRRLGKALLINNVIFQVATMADRRGAEIDACNIKTVFKDLGLDVDEMTDATDDEIVRKLETIAAMDHSDYDCFVCVIMSHGDVDGIWAKDRKIDLKVLMQLLNSRNCASLKGKPKIFFFQCSRGKEKDMGCAVAVTIKKDKTCSDAEGDYSEYRPAPEVPGDNAITFPEDVDFLLVYSSADGKSSYRNTQEGTPFISALCEQLRLLISTGEEDIFTILHRVNNDVAINYQAPDGSKQMPCFVSMLRKNFKLKKKF